ncbi:MAG: lipocalin family protein [Proteobacteria bacterium]|jgi:apolipoprotein D and lipocalin family protein|nr:lipocalin family protein [Pseudomonadota bacterium]
MTQVISALFYIQAALATPSLPVVESVDLKQYQGIWYEISRLPNFFQRGCEASKATYTLKEDSLFEVLNECREESPDGPLSSITGRAWPKDETNAKLKIQFVWPFTGNYWITELADDYSWVVVGDPSRKYLWIMARTPKMDEGLYQELLERARAKEFDVSTLIRTRHSLEQGFE